MGIRYCVGKGSRFEVLSSGILGKRPRQRSTFDLQSEPLKSREIET